MVDQILQLLKKR